MSKLFRPVLILLLVLLPLRVWAQAGMGAEACAMHGAMPTQQAAPSHGMEAAEMATGDATSMSSLPSCHDQPGADCATHDHLHCVICQLAVGQPPAMVLMTTHAAQHPCPTAADTAWHSAELQSLQRPPRA